MPPGPAGYPALVHRGGDEIDLVMVTMVFDAADAEGLLAVLSKYVVLTRRHAGCRNVDLAASATRAGRFVIVEKWETATAQREHLDSPATVEMAQGCLPLLAGPPEIDLLEPISAHDLS